MTDTVQLQAICRFRVHETLVLADPDGVLVVPEVGLLVVSDLHFEKGSSFAVGGQMLPPYDTRTTLRRLAEAIERHQPRTVIALGDSFHDTRADQRMHDEDAATLCALVNRLERWIWIEGNHDPAPPPQFGGEVTDEIELAGLVFRHEPTEGAAPGEVAGHLHPCAKVRRKGRSVRNRCFATDGTRLILPAFGAYTGGLNVCDDAFTRCFGGTPDAMIMGRDRVWPVAAKACVPDRY
ncbi:ligase-associated DNA damage response endonuclease PdeM [Maricaulis parjimensis]|uniref:ligase-associated DNA damage response endonuclease PdeM n=1 Tax=Maricaulis parjimensis TaxID=144023 RepID=UPI001EEE0355|nr:ligase-associated DNA damage response endonuclease PdeM [Maricaulis parjimensis]